MALSFSETDMDTEKMLKKCLICAVCEDVYRKPKTLTCQHSFCKGCLNKHFKRHKIMSCPSCGEATQLPLRDNLFLEMLLQESKKLAELKTACCMSCKKSTKTAKKACMQCSLLLCTDCHSNHESMAENAEMHSTFDVQLLEEKKWLKEFYDHKYSECNHHKLPEKYFYDRNNSKMCYLCASSMEEHATCRFRPLEDEIVNAMAELEVEEGKLADIKSIITVNQEAMEAVIMEIKSAKCKSLQQIQKQKQLMLQMIEIQCKALEDQVKGSAKEGISILEAKMKKNYNILQLISEKQKMSDALSVMPISTRLDASMMLTKEIQESLSCMRVTKKEESDEKHIVHFTSMPTVKLEECLSMGKIQQRQVFHM